MFLRLLHIYICTQHNRKLSCTSRIKFYNQLFANQLSVAAMAIISFCKLRKCNRMLAGFALALIPSNKTKEENNFHY